MNKHLKDGLIKFGWDRAVAAAVEKAYEAGDMGALFDVFRSLSIEADGEVAEMVDDIQIWRESR